MTPARFVFGFWQKPSTYQILLPKSVEQRFLDIRIEIAVPFSELGFRQIRDGHSAPAAISVMR
jgi:hypothetical protein